MAATWFDPSLRHSQNRVRSGTGPLPSQTGKTFRPSTFQAGSGFAPGGGQEGREEVRHDDDLVGNDSGGDVVRPADGGGHADSAFPKGPLLAPEGVVAVEGVARPLVPRLERRPVVAREDDERVFRQLQVVECREDPTHVAIEPRDHRRVGGVERGAGIGFGELPFVQLNLVSRCLDVVVRGDVGQVQEERSVSVPLEVVDRPVGKEVVGMAERRASSPFLRGARRGTFPRRAWRR